MTRSTRRSLASLLAVLLSGAACGPAPSVQECTIRCGAGGLCPAGSSCRLEDGYCHASSASPSCTCTPAACGALAGACGEALDDGCGGTIACGCPVGQVCGEDGRCGCASPDWTVVTLASGARTGVYTGAALDARGALHVCYVDGDAGVGYASWAADAGAPTLETIDASRPATGCAIAIDAAGIPTALFYRWTNNGGSFWLGDLTLARRPPAGWTVRDLLALGEMYFVASDYTALAVAPDGALHGLFFTLDPSFADVHHGSAVDGEAPWSFSTIAQGGDVGSGPSAWSSAGNLGLAIGPDGTVHVTFHDYVAGALRYARRAPGGAFEVDPEPVEAPGAAVAVGLFSSLALDAGGDLHVAYQVARGSDDGALWHAWRAAEGGGAWTIEPVDPPNESTPGAVGATDVPLAIDAAGALHVAYYDYRAGDLRHAVKPAGEGWRSETVDSDGDVGAAAALVVGPRGGAGLVAVSYFEASATGGQGALRLATRCE